MCFKGTRLLAELEAIRAGRVDAERGRDQLFMEGMEIQERLVSTRNRGIHSSH